MKNNKNIIIVLLFSIFNIRYLPRGIIFCFLFLWGSMLNSQDTWIQTDDPINWTTNATRDILWEYWYDPFGADGYNVRPHMAVCSDGGFAVTGYYVIEDGMGGYLDWCGYVMKISSEGELLWADPDTLNFMGENESWAVIETSDGGLINCGAGYMIKRDSEGNRLWSQQLDYAPYTMCFSHDGNIALSGGTPDEYTLFRIIDEDGNEILNNDFNLGYSTSIRRIIPTSDDGYALTGSITQEVGYHGDIIVIKTNANGDTLWTFQKDGCGDSDKGNWILENSENKLLIVGGILPEPITIRGYLALFDLNGNNIWEEIVGNNDIWYEHFYAIDIPEEASYIISTLYRFYKCDYDYTNIEWISSEPYGYFQMLSEGFIFYIGGIDGVHLMKTDDNIVGIDDNVILIKQQNLKCYPNPFNPSTVIQFSLPDNIKNPVIEIFNTKGQLIEKLPVLNNQLSVEWYDDKIASGLYLYRINSENYISETKKMTLIK